MVVQEKQETVLEKGLRAPSPIYPRNQMFPPPRPGPSEGCGLCEGWVQGHRRLHHQQPDPTASWLPWKNGNESTSWTSGP